MGTKGRQITAVPLWRPSAVGASGHPGTRWIVVSAAEECGQRFALEQRLIAPCERVPGCPLQNVRQTFGMPPAAHQLPRWLDSNAQQQNLGAAHAVSPVRNPVPSMAQYVGEFHSE